MTIHENQINKVVTAFFAAFDNRNGREPDFRQFKKLFIDGAVIGNRSSSGVSLWSLDDFWMPRHELLTDGRLTDFHEWEVESETRIYSNIASRHSIYEKSGLLSSKAYSGKGTKCFQFALTINGWQITSVLWEDDE